MEFLPQVKRSNTLCDATSVLQRVFYQELEASVPSETTASNISASLQRDSGCGDLDSTTQKSRLVLYSDNVLKAYKNHAESMASLERAEQNLLQVEENYKQRERNISNKLRLHRLPSSQQVEHQHVLRYNLIDGNLVGPPNYLTNIDFTLQSGDSQRRKARKDLKKLGTKLPAVARSLCPALSTAAPGTTQGKRLVPRKKRVHGKGSDTFCAQPDMVVFTDYKIGDVYQAVVGVTNVSTQPVRFNLKPDPAGGPFAVSWYGASTRTIRPGLGFKLKIRFTPSTLDDVSHDVIMPLEDSTFFRVPLVAYLDPPILQSYGGSGNIRPIHRTIECGACFVGDSTSLTIRLTSNGRKAQFCILSYVDWVRKEITSVTLDNEVSVPPFTVWPAYFELNGGEVVDLQVDMDSSSCCRPGLQVEKLVMACENGEARSIDLFGDTVLWQRHLIAFQDDLLKECGVDEVGSSAAVYKLHLGGCGPTGSLQTSFWLANNSPLQLDFRWELRSPHPQDQVTITALDANQLRVEPAVGMLEPFSSKKFLVSVQFAEAAIAQYRSILRFFVVNVPRECIADRGAVVRPSVVRNSCLEEATADSVSADFPSVEYNPEESLHTVDKCSDCPFFTPSHALSLVHLGEGEFAWGVEPNPDDADETTSHEERSRPRCSFVDVLVDEVEVSALVLRCLVTVDPQVVLCRHPIRRGDTCLEYLRVCNHSPTPVACQWLSTKDLTTASETARIEDSCKVGAEEPEVLRTTATCSVVGTPSCSQFTIAGCSEVQCELQVSCTLPGPVQGVVFLNVHGGDVLKVEFYGKCWAEERGLSSSILVSQDQETRWTQQDKLEQHLFNCQRIGELLRCRQSRVDMKKDEMTSNEETIPAEELCSDDRIHLNTAVPGYVKSHELCLKTLRLENAILAPAGKMYLGRLVSMTVAVRNLAPVKTPFSWGECFGLHSSHAKVHVTPRCGVVEPLGSLQVVVQITPLEQGIVEYFYIPCFVDRQPEPLIMSLVGVIEQLHVTFEILDPDLCCKDSKELMKRSCGRDTARRISWPVRPLHKEFHIQKDILHMLSPCQKDDGQENKRWRQLTWDKTLIGDDKQSAELTREDDKQSTEFTREDDKQSTEFTREDDKQSTEFTREDDKQNTEFTREDDKQSAELTREDDKQNTEFTREDDKQNTEFTREDDKQSTEFTRDDIKNTDQIVEVILTPRPSVMHANCIESHLEFLQVPMRTAVCRSFVIRNETPLDTSFQIFIQKFAERNWAGKVDDITLAMYEAWNYHQKVWQSRLAEDQPLLIVAEPSSGLLLGGDAVLINIWSYGNTCGEYRDVAVCQVQDLPDFHLKLFIQVVSNPPPLTMSLHVGLEH